MAAVVTVLCSVSGSPQEPYIMLALPLLLSLNDPVSLENSLHACSLNSESCVVDRQSVWNNLVQQTLQLSRVV